MRAAGMKVTGQLPKINFDDVAQRIFNGGSVATAGTGQRVDGSGSRRDLEKITGRNGFAGMNRFGSAKPTTPAARAADSIQRLLGEGQAKNAAELLAAIFEVPFLEEEAKGVFSAQA